LTDIGWKKLERPDCADIFDSALSANGARSGSLVRVACGTRGNRAASPRQPRVADRRSSNDVKAARANGSAQSPWVRPGRHGELATHRPIS